MLEILYLKTLRYSKSKKIKLFDNQIIYKAKYFLYNNCVNIIIMEGFIMAFDKVKSLIASGLGVDESEITLESNLQDDLGADSLDAVELIMAVEEEFGIEIPDEDAQNIKSVQDIVSYVENNA